MVCSVFYYYLLFCFVSSCSVSIVGYNAHLFAPFGDQVYHLSVQRNCKVHLAFNGITYYPRFFFRVSRARESTMNSTCLSARPWRHDRRYDLQFVITLAAAHLLTPGINMSPTHTSKSMIGLSRRAYMYVIRHAALHIRHHSQAAGLPFDRGRRGESAEGDREPVRYFAVSYGMRTGWRGIK